MIAIDPQELATLRAERGLTQEALAKKSGVSVPTISRAENQKQISRTNAQTIADTLGANLDQFFLELQPGQAAEPLPTRPDVSATTHIPASSTMMPRVAANRPGPANDGVITLPDPDDGTVFSGLEEKHKERKYPRTTDTATVFAETFNAGGRRIIGAVIETHAHPNLESGLPLSEVGWSANEIVLRLKRGSFDAEPILSDASVEELFQKREREHHEGGRPSILTPPDGVKYVVVDASSPFLDVNDFQATLQETRYFSIMKARPAIEESLQIRQKFGHVEPRNSRTPQSMGLQFIVLFSGQNVLAIQRAKDTFPFPGTWSFSGEEQCAPVDLSWNERDRMKNFMLRAVLEEVFPLARTPDGGRLLPVMEEVHRYVDEMRICSLFLEEPTVTFSFFAIFRFNLTVEQYSVEVRKLVQSGRGTMSHEGDYFAVALADVPRLLIGDDIVAKPIFGGKALYRVGCEKLHPTSLYRLTRLVEILNRKPNQPNQPNVPPGSGFPPKKGSAL